MKDLYEFVTKFEGIIGTLLGVIVTLIVTQILKSFGKLRFYLLENNLDYRGKINEWGSEESEENINEAKYLIINASLEIYNGSEIPKILREIKINFYSDKRYIFSIIPTDKDTEKYAAAQYHYENIHHINLPPKSIRLVKIRGLINNEQLELYKQCNTVFLEVKNHKGKTQKAFLCNI